MKPGVLQGEVGTGGGPGNLLVEWERSATGRKVNEQCRKLMNT